MSIHTPSLSFLLVLYCISELLNAEQKTGIFAKQTNSTQIEHGSLGREWIDLLGDVFLFGKLEKPLEARRSKFALHLMGEWAAECN
jgi:hypothetical protein